MYLLLILFFISLIGIIVMIGRKLAVITSGQIIEKKYAHHFVPNLQKIKLLAFENIKKYGHLSIVAILRLYIRFSNFLKYKYEEVKIKVKNISSKNKSRLVGDSPKRQEVSKFLKMISDYKQKIREITHKIKEEEKKL